MRVPRTLGELDAGEVPYTAAVPARLGWVREAGWARVTRGAYRRERDAATLLDDLAGWQSVLPGSAVFTGLTGAQLRGWWLPPLPLTVPVFVALCNGPARPRRPGLAVYRPTAAVEWESLGGLRVANAPEILLLAGRDLGLLDLVVLADAALHRGDCDREGLQRAAGRRRHGAPALRRALRYVDGRAESAWETVLRMLLASCDVPVDPQHRIRDNEGNLVARADLRICGTPRLPEYDGAGHREARQHVRDLARERLLLRLGWERFGYTSGVLLHNAGSVLRDADEALGRPHRPERIRAWHRLLAESLFTASGRTQVAARWAARSC